MDDSHGPETGLTTSYKDAATGPSRPMAWNSPAESSARTTILARNDRTQEQSGTDDAGHFEFYLARPFEDLVRGRTEFFTRHFEAARTDSHTG